MPSLFRRKPADLVEDAVAGSENAVTEAESATAGTQHTRGYTPPKSRATPKRPRAGQGREAPPADRKEAAKRARERERLARQEQRAGMLAGDEQFLLARDRGPERALVRDVVDARRTAGTWFFSAAFIVLAISSLRALPPAALFAANIAWLVLGLGVILDSVLICRRISKLVQERFPKTTQRMGALYLYAVMRSLSYRRFRIPKPRVRIGEET